MNETPEKKIIRVFNSHSDQYITMNGSSSKGEALSTHQRHAKVKRSIQVVPPEKEVRGCTLVEMPMNRQKISLW